MKFFKKLSKKEQHVVANSRDAAKERLHLVLMQDRANVSADFLELMKQEIIEVIKKYIDVDEEAIDVRLTNKENEDGTNGAPALYANIPIVNIKNEAKKAEPEVKVEEAKEEVEKKQEKEKTDNTLEEKEKIKETKTNSKVIEEKKKSKKTSKKEEKAEIIIDDGQKEDKQGEQPAKEKEKELKSEN